MNRLIVAFLCSLMLLCLVGCETDSQAAVEGALLSCVGKPKAEVCKILKLEGTEHYTGGGAYGENTLQKEMNWCGEKINTCIAFYGEKDDQVSLVAATEMLPEGDEAYTNMKSCLAKFTKQFGEPIGYTEAENGAVVSDGHTYDSAKLDSYFSDFEAAGAGRSLHFRFEGAGKSYGVVECGFAKFSESPGEIRVQFTVYEKDFFARS